MDELGYRELLTVLGSAAKPSLSFTEETDTGIFIKSDGVVGIAGGGAEIAHIDSTGIGFGYNAKIFAVCATLADEGTLELPAHTTFMFGVVVAKAGATIAIFTATALGAVTLLTDSTDDVVANATTDSKLDIGLTNPDNPIVIKNNLGDSYDVNVFIVYY